MILRRYITSRYCSFFGGSGCAVSPFPPSRRLPSRRLEEEAPAAVKKDAPQQAVLHKKLLEETQQLRVQMDEYEDELTDLSDGVEKTNKLLNFVLCFLILVLLVIIGFIAYSLWKAGGI